MSSIRFDDSLPVLLGEVQDALGAEALDRVTVLREAAGRLSLLYDGELDDAQKEALAGRAATRLAQYARTDRLVGVRGEPGVARLLEEPRAQWLPYGARRIRYLDRRVVGADWLAPLAPEAPPPPRVVFSSLKGGVGRTTALCVAATDWARRGKNVLVVDLDLEAPGAGTLLLRPDETPRFGALDFLVESVLVEPSQDLVADMVAPSLLTRASSGRVDVVPAYGTATRPENYLGKLARALFDAGPAGSQLSVHRKAARLLDAVPHEHGYDVVFIDARAGLGELSAGPLLSLGATVLLFGTCQRQATEGYRVLFAHLASLVQPETCSPWDRLCMVLAKAPPDAALHEWFLVEMHTLFQDYLYELEEADELGRFNFDLKDQTGPHYPIAIALNPLFAEWDPTRRPDQLAQPFYEATFRPFLDGLARRLREQS